MPDGSSLVAARLEAIEGLLDLMRTAGTLDPERDAIIPFSNGYSTWFITTAQAKGDWEQVTKDGNSPTSPVSAEEILRRIDARKALS